MIPILPFPAPLGTIMHVTGGLHIELQGHHEVWFGSWPHSLHPPFSYSSY
jgi:hypothetical protein